MPREALNEWLFRTWAKRQHFDLIYANTVGSLPKAIELKQTLKAPVLLHIHETERTCIRRGITKEMMRKCDQFVSVSSLSTHALESYGVKRENIHVIPPFSEHLGNIKVQCIDHPEIDKDTFVIGMSGVGGWRKGSDVFPMIVKRFITKYPKVKCKFVWLGALNPAETPYDLKQLGIEKYVVTPGLVKNPMQYYKRFDVFLLTSREDPFPLVCMENAALGNPIILFEGTSGIVDLVRNGETGIAVPYLDVEAMADSIYLLYSQPDLRNRLGSNVCKLLQSDFGKKQSLDKLLHLLEK